MFWFICEWVIVRAHEQQSKLAIALVPKKPIRTRFNRMEWSWYFFFRSPVNFNEFTQFLSINCNTRLRQSRSFAARCHLLFANLMVLCMSYERNFFRNNSAIANSKKWYQNLPKVMNKDIFHYSTKDIDSSQRNPLLSIGCLICNRCEFILLILALTSNERDPICLIGF